jgi:hypothetical protein
MGCLQSGQCQEKLAKQTYTRDPHSGGWGFSGFSIYFIETENMTHDSIYMKFSNTQS